MRKYPPDVNVSEICIDASLKMVERRGPDNFPRFLSQEWCAWTIPEIALKHLCLSGMVGIIQSKITWFWGYILLSLLCSMLLISPNFAVKLIIFSQFWPGGLFPKLLEKALRKAILILSYLLLFVSLSWCFTSQSTILQSCHAMIAMFPA